MTSQCFCMNSTLGRERCSAMRCTQCPTSASGSGMYCECRPRLIGFHVLPPSSVRKAPAAEMAMYMRFGLAGSSRIVWRHIPPAPGCHLGPVPWPRSPGRLPRLAAVAGALDDLSEPPARLGRVQPVRVDRRALEVVDLPAREVRATDIPPFALAVRRQDERALARTDQDSYSAHGSLPLKGPRFKVFVERTGAKSGQSVFLPVFARSRSSCSRNSGLSAAPKSSASNTWRISTSPSWKGARFSQSIASFSDFTCHSQKPAISSFVSVNGPSITVRLLPANLTRAPLELAWSPSPARSMPAFSSS